MGSHLHPYVQSLRNFRDNILLQSRHKTSFENLLSMYYRLSPPLARSMNRYLILKIFLRYALVYPIVFGIKAVLYLLPCYPDIWFFSIPFTSYNNNGDFIA
ncbi:MAG: CFI-box-CTERM domain-containing protein [Nitrososphaeraceae archaeon]